MFWKRFHELCQLHNTSPYAVCKSLNFSNATAAHWKKGCIPKGEALCSIADYFDCSVDYLLGRTDIPHYKKSEHMEILINGIKYEIVPKK